MANAYHKKVGNYIFVQSIGKGAFAEVFMGKNRITHEDVAIKMLFRSKDPKDDIQIEKEIRILKELNHENIVRFMEFQKTQNHYYLIFEFCQHGDLERFIRDFYNGKVPEHEAQKLIQQIVAGIKAMKTKNIVHRDLKLANILVSKDFILKIADFGLARFHENDAMLLKSMVGTPLNMDPLILQKKNYNEKCDIWSLGVIFYQILTGKAPFNPGRGGNLADLLHLIETKPLTFPSDITLSDSIKDLIKRMLIYDVEKRLSFEELFNHEWVTGKYIAEDPSKAPEMDLSATQLLQSMYNKKLSEIKKDRESKRKQSIVQDKEKVTPPVQVKEEVKEEEPKPQVQPQKEAKTEDLNEVDKRKELYVASFLAKAYEIFRNKIYQLREYYMKIQNIVLPKESSIDDGRFSIVKIILSLDMLKMLKEVLSFKFGIINEENEEVIFNDDFKTFWNIIMENKTAIENFYTTDDASLEITDLFSQVKQDFLEMYDSVTAKVDELKDTFERFKGHNLDKLLLDCLIQLSENSAYQEYLEENTEAKVNKYAICQQICEFLLFRNNFRFTYFKIVPKGAQGDKDMNQLGQYVSSMFQNHLKFNVLMQLSQKEEYKRQFNQIKKNIEFSDYEGFQSNEFDATLRQFQTIINRRIEDLKGRIEEECS